MPPRRPRACRRVHHQLPSYASEINEPSIFRLLSQLWSTNSLSCPGPPNPAIGEGIGCFDFTLWAEPKMAMLCLQCLCRLASAEVKASLLEELSWRLEGFVGLVWYGSSSILFYFFFSHSLDVADTPRAVEIVASYTYNRRPVARGGFRSQLAHALRIISVFSASTKSVVLRNAAILEVDKTVAAARKTQRQFRDRHRNCGKRVRCQYRFSIGTKPPSYSLGVVGLGHGTGTFIEKVRDPVISSSSFSILSGSCRMTLALPCVENRNRGTQQETTPSLISLSVLINNIESCETVSECRAIESEIAIETAEDEIPAVVQSAICPRGFLRGCIVIRLSGCASNKRNISMQQRQSEERRANRAAAFYVTTDLVDGSSAILMTTTKYVVEWSTNEGGIR